MNCANESIRCANNSVLVHSELQALDAAAVDPERYLQLIENLAQFRARLRSRAATMDIMRLRTCRGKPEDCPLAGQGGCGRPRYHYHPALLADSTRLQRTIGAFNSGC